MIYSTKCDNLANYRGGQMSVYTTRCFQKWADKEGLQGKALLVAAEEIDNGLIDARLGGHVVKKRIALTGRGKRGGARALVAYQRANRTFFVYGFAKNERSTISEKELKALKLLANQLLGLSEREMASAIKAGELIEVVDDG